MTHAVEPVNKPMVVSSAHKCVKMMKIWCRSRWDRLLHALQASRKLHEDLHHALMTLSHDKPDDHRPVAVFITAKVTDLLRKGNQKYNKQPMRLGSLIRLLRSGVPLEQIRVKTKHCTIQ